MRKIPSKNYIILVVLLVVTVFLTLLLANIYTSKNKLTSSFYEYSNKISIDEFEQYLVENPDAIVYISDKYDLTHETFEEKFKEKIDNLNLKKNLVFINKEEIDRDFIKKLNNNYKINIDINTTPIILVTVDKKIVKSIYVDKNSNVDTFIDYEIFE